MVESLYNKKFKFTITNPNKSESGESEYETSLGFVDGKRFYEYEDFDLNDSTKTIQTYISKSAGFLRWVFLSLSLSKFGIVSLNIDKLTNANSYTEPSQISFTIEYEQPNSIFEYVSKEEYDSNDGDKEITKNDKFILKNITALKMIVAKALSTDIKSFATIYDSTPDNWNKNEFGRDVANLPRGFFNKEINALKLFDTYDQANDYINIEEVSE